jgi:hypothetical protein
VAGDDFRRLSIAAEQWMLLCRQYMDANREYREALEALRRGELVAHEAVEERKQQLDAAMEACRYFIRNRMMPP